MAFFREKKVHCGALIAQKMVLRQRLVSVGHRLLKKRRGDGSSFAWFEGRCSTTPQQNRRLSSSGTAFQYCGAGDAVQAARAWSEGKLQLLAVTHWQLAVTQRQLAVTQQRLAVTQRPLAFTRSRERPAADYR